jgi:putative endonuclease
MEAAERGWPGSGRLANTNFTPSVIARLDRAIHALTIGPCVFYIYILASQKRGTLYIGVTNDIARRLEEHRAGKVGSFTTRYRVFRLVHVEQFDSVDAAIAREKRLKKWPRAWKIRLIEENNPTWSDLARWPLD